MILITIRTKIIINNNNNDNGDNDSNHDSDDDNNMTITMMSRKSPPSEHFILYIWKTRRSRWCAGNHHRLMWKCKKKKQAQLRAAADRLFYKSTSGFKWRDIMHYKQCFLSLTNSPHFIMPWNSDRISIHFCSPIAGFLVFSKIVLETSKEQK